MAGTLYFHCRGPRFNPRSHKLRLVAWDQKKRPRNGKEHAASGELQEFFYYSFTCLALCVMVNVRWGVEL